MDVDAHLQALIEGRTDEGDTPSQDDVELLALAIRAAIDPAPQPAGRRAEPPEGVYVSEGGTIWDDILAASQHDGGDGPVASTSTSARRTTSSVTQRLQQHAMLTAHGDTALYQSMLSSVEACLEGAVASSAADEASIVLAETLGFEQLDLVEAVVKDRQAVLADLRAGDGVNGMAEESAAEVSRPHRAVTSPAIEHTTHATSSAKPYTPGSSVVIHTKEETEQNKRLRAEQRRQQRARGHHHDSDDNNGENNTLYTAEEMAILRAQSLQAAAERPLYTSDRATTEAPRYPHVFASGPTGNVLNAFGTKFSLPVGTTRQDREFYEEVTIPPPRQLPFRSEERLLPIDEMDPLARGAFPGYASLNRLQSVVYPLGYGSGENLLICAPTGAGKTDVAMLTVLRTIKMHARMPDARVGNAHTPTSNPFAIQYDDFKIIYVAPMKALAAEVVAKFSKRLRYLGVKVRELTGDMQMTRKEIAETQMIVTTPEKWDVVTRKPTGEGELVAKVKLLIIDEVHLLHEERGAVIETIVARTLRLVESSQSLIRIVGLSATLPNYVDVADFLRVNRYQGLFFFDSSFRPVPLEQHFLGVKGKANSPIARQRMDKATFEKLQELVEQGHQIMIFVHARKETVKTAYGMRDLCREEGMLDMVTQAREEGNPDAFRRDVAESRNRELKELYETGFGIHHAGMLRKDRTLSERLFSAGVTRVLCCTSTLAWGVNLPAYAVLIKGTDIYDSSLGRFSDLSILDVLQIFGRAGRPQYEKVGVGYIITSHDKLSHYVDAITAQHPIESKFKAGMIDALNAEAALGSVNSIADGVIWLSYTYMFTRMRRNPLAYGMLADEVADDPQLGAKRLHEITAAARYLSTCGMLELDDDGARLSITELGRIAARYYITYRTVEVFNEKLRNNMTEADWLAVFGHATDFEQVVPRENEVQELKKLEVKVPCEISGARDTAAGKANLLLQAFISRLYVDDFALVSDTGYLAQNAGRVMRALFETALSRRWAGTAAAALGLARSVERRLWPFDHPLAQSTHLRPDMVHQLTQWADEVEVKELATMSNDELMKLCKVNARHAEAIRHAARRFPALGLQYRLKPLTYDLLRIDVLLQREYDWSDERSNSNADSGPAQSFYVWVEDEEGSTILQCKRVVFHPRSSAVQPLSFTIDQIAIAASHGVTIRWISERWLGAEDMVFASTERLRMADPPQGQTILKDLPLVHTAELATTLGPAGDAIAARFMTLNAIQTHVFRAALDEGVGEGNTVLCAPHRSGRTLLAHMAVLRAVQQVQAGTAALILVVYPTLALAHQAMAALQTFVVGVDVQLARSANELVAPITGQGLRVVFTVPAVLDDALLLKEDEAAAIWLSALQLVVVEDVQMLDVRSELSIGMLRRAIDERADVRWFVTCVFLENPTALQTWLGGRRARVYNFSGRDRPSVLQTTVVPFTMAHSLYLLKAMVKPAYDRMRNILGHNGRAVVVVPSRAQTLMVARDLVRQAASSDTGLTTFMGARATSNEVEPYVAGLRDKGLAEVVLGGVGAVWEGMAASDRRMVLSLYASKVVRALIVARDACAGLNNLHCRCIVVMGTQFMRLDEAQVQVEALFGQTTATGEKASRSSGNARLVDYALSDVLRMQAFAASPNPHADGNDEFADDDPTEDQRPAQCFVMCQNDQAGLLRRIVDGGGYLLESGLLDAVSGEEGRQHVALLAFLVRQIASGQVIQRTDALKALQWTFVRHRMAANPSYYGAESGGEEDVQERLLRAADGCWAELASVRCIEVEQDGRQAVRLTPLGEMLAASTTIDLLSRLLALSRQYTRDGDATARQLLHSRAFRAFAGRSRRNGKDDSILARVLDATRSCTPSDLLARFGVPRLARKTAAVVGIKQDATPAAVNGASVDSPGSGTATTAKAEVEAEQPPTPLTDSQRDALLLAVFFSPAHAIRTPAEAAQLKSKTTVVARAAAKAAAAHNPEQRAEAEDAGCVSVRDALQADMFALVESVLCGV